MSKQRLMGFSACMFVLIIIISAVALGCGGGEKGSDVGIDSSAEYQSLGDEDNARSTPASGTAGDQIMAAQESTGKSDNISSFPQLQLLVIKTALMKMETGKGEYAKIREDAVAIASSIGGYVESESSSRNDEGLTYASITLRVPAESFDYAVSQVSSLGEVISNNVSSNDVSGEYVDLESRLIHLQAEESFYMSLIGQAQSIQEMITIRQYLDSIQLEKEKAQGRKNFLESQIGYSTLTLSVDEVSTDVVSGEKTEEGFWHSVGEAYKGFGRGLSKLGLGFFYALPYLIILAVLAAMVWLFVRRFRHDKPSI